MALGVRPAMGGETTGAAKRPMVSYAAPMPTFQRARNEEQRAARRETILLTASAMLEEMPVAEVSLNELSRRVGLAKSNVLRYFESREEVLLVLLAQAAAEFLVEVTESIPAKIDHRTAVNVRARTVATALGAAFAAHPILCELLSAQAVILEHNVSAQVALRHKRSGRDSIAGLAVLLRHVLPELGEPSSLRAAQLIIVLVGGFWVRGRPSHSVRDAYEMDPSVAFLSPDFPEGLTRAIAPCLIGLAAEAGERLSARS